MALDGVNIHMKDHLPAVNRDQRFQGFKIRTNRDLGNQVTM